MQPEQEEKGQFLFRPPTAPISRHRHHSRRRQRLQPITRDSNVIRRPQQNFFKLIFQRGKYLWVVMHSRIFDNSNMETVHLKHRFEDVFKGVGFEEDKIPLCTNAQQLQYWTKEKGYQCKVALDESMLNQFDQVFPDPNVVMVFAVTVRDVKVVKSIRKSPFSYKVRAIEDDYSSILQMMKEDLEKVRIQTEGTHLEKVRLPNFMRLRLKDKAELISYRNNIYGMTNLHLNQNDMQVSKKRFIEQCEKSYTSNKDKEAMKYYLTYPFSDRQILRFYTEDYFFYKCLNNTLRMAKTTEEFFVIGQPLNKMFNAIKNTYRQQYPYKESRANLRVYRGADLSQTETKYLRDCKGSYIEIHGFVSTTLSIDTAKGFAKQRNHNKIIEISFEDIGNVDPKILDNDYGFVNLIDISRYEEAEILFNTLNIFKVVGWQERDGFEVYMLRYGSIFNVLNIDTPDKLRKLDRVAYYTYKELMGEKTHLEDLGQVFLKSNETQKSVDYYESKIIEAKGQNKSKEVSLIIKKSDALIQNGEPAKALQNMIMLLSERKTIQKTQSGAKFLENVLNNKEEILKEIDISKKYSLASNSLDSFDDAEENLNMTNMCLEDALQEEDRWNFDVAFGQVEVKMQMAHVKESMQNYSEMIGHLREAEELADEIWKKGEQVEITFHDRKVLLMEKTLIYQLMAKIGVELEGEDRVDNTQLEERYTETEDKLLALVEESYDKSLITIRKVEIQKRREDFKANKDNLLKTVAQSLIYIKETSDRDDEISKSYDLMADMEKKSKSISSTHRAIGYYEKSLVSTTNSHGEHDPRSFQSMIDIAQCNRDLKEPQNSVDLLREQIKVVPYRNKPKHTIVSKTLYTMGMSYLDLGEFSYALKCFEKGLNMLKEILTKKELEKYHHRFRIELQLGRTLTFLIRYNEAEEKLAIYYNFLIRIHGQEHSDIANTLNHQAILYLKWKELERSKDKFEQAAEMFRKTSGEKSLLVAKIMCNLAMINAIFQKRAQALDYVDKASVLFNEIYWKEELQGRALVHSETHMIEYYYAEVNRMCKEWQEAKQHYISSLTYLKKYKEQKEDERRNVSTVVGASVAVSSAMTMLGKLFQTDKKDNHELICRVKVIECQVKLRDPTFKDSLEKVIKDLEKAVFDYKKSENDKMETTDDKVVDQNSASQLNNLLEFCQELNKRFGKGGKKKVRRRGTMADSSIEKPEKPEKEPRLERQKSSKRKDIEKSMIDKSKLNAAADDEALELKQTYIENVREEIKHVN